VTPKARQPNLDSLPKIHAGFIQPMLAELVETLPTSGDWQYEIKLDGCRAIVVKQDGRADLFSRRENRMNEKYPSIAKALDRLPPGTVLDGEIVATDSEGRPDFNALQNWKASEALYYCAFDIMTYKGRDVRGHALSERRRVLEDALSGMADPVRLSPVFDFPVKDIIRAVQEQGLEGIVAKRRDSRYESGKRSGAWLKYKTRKG
jgi:ATP-dependent DNA ligase